MTPVDQPARTSDLEGFYERFWRERSERGSPPRDERDRWGAIRALLERTLAGREETRPGGGPLRILDLGCGRGWLTLRLSEAVAGARVLGVDPLEASIDAARGLHPGLSFEQSTGGELLASGEAGAFDLVVSSEVIEHVSRPEQPRFLAQAFALLRPGGRLILTTPRGELWERWLAGGGRPQPVEAWLGEAELGELARAAGFLVVETARAHVPSRPVTWQGWLDKWILGRRFVRTLPLAPLRRRLQHAACLYQVAALERPHEGAREDRRR